MSSRPQRTPPTAPLPTRGAPGAGSGRSSSAASPPTSPRDARPRLLRLLPALQNPRRPAVPAAGRAAWKAPGSEGQSRCSPPARGEEAMPSAARLPQPKARRDRGCGHGLVLQSRALPAGRLLACFFPRLVFQLIAPGTGGTMPGCSPRSRLPARGFCPNHVPGPERWSRDAAPLGTRGDNGGRLITTSLPLLLNIIPLQPLCRLLARPGGREEPGCCLGKVGARPRASHGAHGDRGMSPGPTRTVCSQPPPAVHPRGAHRPEAPRRAPSSHVLQKWGVFLRFFRLDSPPLGGSRALTRLNLPSPDPCYRLS